MDIFLWIIGLFLLSCVGFYIFMVFFASYLVYTKTLKRLDKSTWSRDSVIENEQQIEMDRLGHIWKNAHLDALNEVHIVNEGLNLYGEYYDFGRKKTVMILSGRTESLRYGYYFAIPYYEAGYNVMVLDNRAHGNSDGNYNTIGFDESRDNIAWAKYLHDEHGVEEIIFHGICIGGAAGTYALTSEGCPDYIVGIVTEGMFTRFWESMKNHIIERKKNFPFLMPAIDMWMKKYTGHSMKVGPIDVIHKLDRPILMLQSREDKYSVPEKAQQLFDKCGSKNKRLVYFDKGGHSLLRITDTEGYDREIKAFLKELESTKEKEKATV